MNWKPLLLLLAFSTSVLAIEDPPGCSLANGGEGNTSLGGLNFLVSRAHVGDTVSLFPVLGMVSNACNSINTTGSIYLSTGLLTNFMVNVTLYPTGAVSCPSASAQCSLGPYSFVITSPMVGAGVTSPLASIPGLANAVRAIENGVGTVTSHPSVNEQLADVHTASQLIVVTPCIQVFEMCQTACETNVNFTGYVLNCGDITLTNIIVTNNRTSDLLNLDGTPLIQPITLTSGSTIPFKGSYVPSGPETMTTTNTLTVSGTDTTPIGGPRASVTNSVTTICNIGSCGGFCGCPCIGLVEPESRYRRYAMR